MATITKRIDNNIRELYDRYNSHWSPTWKADENYGQIGVLTEFQDSGEWYGGIKNLSLRFTGITIPQGATIQAAKITFKDNSSGISRAINLKIVGIDEDNTAEFTTSPIADGRTRAKTTAAVDWDSTFTPSNGTARDTPDITNVIQEIVDRAGWSSGNAIGIYIYDDGTTAGNVYDIKYYGSYPNDVALLTITYLEGSASVSPSASISASASPSASTSPSASSSSSESPSASPSISPSPPLLLETLLLVAKPNIDALRTDDPTKFKFHSKYGTLKYLSKQSIDISFDASTGDISAKGNYTHNLNYYPYVEVYVRVYTGDTPSGNFEPCPFFGSGATVTYSANFNITKTKIQVYGEINGVSTATWHFEFLVFVYKNNLKL